MPVPVADRPTARPSAASPEARRTGPAEDGVGVAVVHAGGRGPRVAERTPVGRGAVLPGRLVRLPDVRRR